MSLETINYVVAIGLGLLFFGMFGWYCWALEKKYKRPVGELLTWKAIVQNESILVLLMLMALFAEAINAATSHAEGVIPPNAMTGMFIHIFIGAVGAIATLTFFRDMGAAFEKNIDGTSRFWRITIIAILGMMVIGSPIAQMLLMAANLKQELELQLYMYSWNPLVTHDDWVKLLQFYHKPEDYSAWAGLQRNLKGSIVVSVFHMLIAVLEGARHMSSKERRNLIFTVGNYEDPDKKKDESKDKNKDESKDKDKNKTAVLENLEFLLQRYGYKDKDKLKKNAKDATNNFHKHYKGAEEGSMAVRIADLRNTAAKIDAGNYGDYANKDAANKALNKQIRELFSGSVNAAKQPDFNLRGLGISLTATGEE